MAVASLLDLNALDNLSRTCRGVRQGLLQYRSSLVTHTLHCVNEDIVVDPEDTFRYRARAGNWFYMQEMGGDRYNGKSGSCARDMVAECRRCAKVVCRVRFSLFLFLSFSRALFPFPLDVQGYANPTTKFKMKKTGREGVDYFRWRLYSHRRVL